MAREVYTVTATQIVVSELHPEGLVSNVSGFPVSFDSNTYNGDGSIAYDGAMASYMAEIFALRTANNANRKGWAVSVIRATDGKQLANRAEGAFPVVPEPEPEPEPEVSEPEEQ